MPLRRRKVRRSTVANFSGEDLCDGGVRRRSAAPMNCPGVEYSRVGGDQLLRQTAAHERWRRFGFSLTAPAIWLSLSLLRQTAVGFSLIAPAIWLSLSLLTVWFLSHCSGVRWRRSGVEKGGGYLVIDINYFPGYENLPCYETVMTDFFLNLMKSHTVKKKTADG
ncbi:hypothetical protein L6452_43050 [Arctium lappa]|uniref:Uncharacterized protein n=1 Tax=Arctium lappa TaxID=4217 RepID=A0ACB8XKP0_ARCLA|nr:hypothetical protein L6452_43050 [Arctium lappa]